MKESLTALLQEHLTENCLSLKSASCEDLGDCIPRSDEWQVLGIGFYSLCLEHRLTKRAVKVSIREGDKAPQYWMYCQFNQGRQYVPRVYELGHITLYGKEYSYVVMDVLVHDRSKYITMGGWQFFEAWAVRRKVDRLGAIDLHSGNVMFDRDGACFVTDPLSCARNRAHTS